MLIGNRKANKYGILSGLREASYCVDTVAAISTWVVSCTFIFIHTCAILVDKDIHIRHKHLYSDIFS